jgi:hypothetical protein
MEPLTLSTKVAPVMFIRATLPLKFFTYTLPCRLTMRMRSLKLEMTRTVTLRGTRRLQCTVTDHGFGTWLATEAVRTTRMVGVPSTRNPDCRLASSYMASSRATMVVPIVASTSVTSAPVISMFPMGLSRANVPPGAIVNFWS